AHRALTHILLPRALLESERANTRFDINAMMRASRFAFLCRAARLGVASLLGLAAHAACGEEAELILPKAAWALPADETVERPSDKFAGNFDFSAKSGNSAGNPEPRKNYLLPALEIVGFETMLNLVNRNDHSGDYKSNLPSIKRNLSSSWSVDHDPFRTNQLGHPYAGSMYHTFARSLGHDYWESFAYTFAGSALWEFAGER